MNSGQESAQNIPHYARVVSQFSLEDRDGKKIFEGTGKLMCWCNCGATTPWLDAYEEMDQAAEFLSRHEEVADEIGIRLFYSLGELTGYRLDTDRRGPYLVHTCGWEKEIAVEADGILTNLVLQAVQNKHVCRNGKGGSGVNAKRVRKIVRDHIPQMVDEATAERNPAFFLLGDLEPDEQVRLWLEKLQEELDELKAAFSESSSARRTEDRRLEELADLTEVLAGFQQYFRVSPWELKKQMDWKGDRNGCFWSARVMEWDELPSEAAEGGEA